jgi:hypothetical protein
MATVISYTKDKIDELLGNMIATGMINSFGDLILTTQGGTPINAGFVGVGSLPGSLGTIASLTPSNGDVLTYLAGSWSTSKPVPGLRKIYLDNYGADWTGATYSDTALAAAQTAGGSGPYQIVQGIGQYKFANSYSFKRGQVMIGQGSALTNNDYTGNSIFIDAYDPSFDLSLSNTGEFGGFSIGGYSSGNGAVGFRWGDLNRIQIRDLQITGFNGVGSIGLYGHNVAGWSEQALIQANVVDCTTCVYFDKSSFDFSTYEFLIVANPNQDGIRFENGANIVGPRFAVRGNFHAGATNTGAVIAMDRSDTSTGTTSFIDAEFDIVVECDGTPGQVGHHSILQLGGNAATMFTGNGTISFTSGGGGVQFQDAVFTGQYGFGGRINIPGLGNVDPNDGLVVQGASQWAQSGNLTGNYAYDGMYIYPNGGDYQAYILPNGNITIAGFWNAPYGRTRNFKVAFRQPSGGAPGTITLPSNVELIGGNRSTTSASNETDVFLFTYYPSDDVWFAEILSTDAASGPSVGPFAESDIIGLVADLASINASISAISSFPTLTPGTNDFLEYVGGVWTNRTPTQVKATLAIAESDVSGLTTDLSTLTSSIAAIRQFPSLTPGANDFLEYVSGSWTNRTPAQVKTTLAIAEADVSGLVTDLAGKQSLNSNLTTIAGLTPTNNDTLQYISGAWANRTPTQAKATLAIAEADVSGLVADLASINSTISTIVASSVALDTTATDIQPSPGTRSVGSVSLAAKADHVHGSPTVFAPTGITGATATTRYVGATTTGAPASGTFALGDVIPTQDGTIYICTTAGTVGSGAAFTQAGGSLDSTDADIQPVGSRTAGVLTQASRADHRHPYAGKTYALSLYRTMP